MIVCFRERLGGDDEMVNKVTTEDMRTGIMSRRAGVGRLSLRYVLETLSESEDWLYEDGFDAQLEEYTKRLDSLKKAVVG